MKKPENIFPQFLKKVKSDVIISENRLSSSAMTEKEIAFYSNEHIEVQRLYERWICKKSWLLKDQAIPLLLGQDPDIDNNEDKFNSMHEELWLHVKTCAEKGLLAPLINQQDESDKWEVSPEVIYRWASISRMDLPHEFTNLMDFVLTTVKKDIPADEFTNFSNIADAQGEKNITKHSLDKEKILGATLAILASDYEYCLNEKGKLKAEKIIKLINEKSDLLFGNDKPSLSTAVCKDMLDTWLNKAT